MSSLVEAIIPSYYENENLLREIRRTVSRSCFVTVVHIIRDVPDKGTAMAMGLDLVSAPRVAFFDADIMGLTDQNVDDMLRYNHDHMVVGQITPIPSPFSGQRVMPTELARMANLRDTGYGAETALAKAALVNGVPISFVRMSNVYHRSTEDKGKPLSLHVKRWAEVGKEALGL